MYRVPKDLDLSPIVRKSTTQISVGQFDLQFTFGDVDFGIMSSLGRGKVARCSILRHNEHGSHACEVMNDRLIVIAFAKDIEMHLTNDSDHYECMKIFFKGEPSPWII